MVDLRAVLVVFCLLICNLAAQPVYESMGKIVPNYGETLNAQDAQDAQDAQQPGFVSANDVAAGRGESAGVRLEKRRWLFPTQKSMSPLYPTTDCTEDLGIMINQFRRMPRGKDRDAMIAAIYSYCANKGV